MKFHENVDLDKQQLNPIIRDVRQRYATAHGTTGGKGIYTKYDWTRISYAFELIGKARSVLEVGIGSGQLINSLALSGRFQTVAGLDIQMHSKFVRFSDGYDVVLESIDAMTFPDNAFDCIICMEVLEHVGPNTFARGLEHLRRVCRYQLIMSVPYNEPLPLPSYHKQRFTDEDVMTHFPNARRHLLQRPRVPWLLLEESLG